MRIPQALGGCRALKRWVMAFMVFSTSMDMSSMAQYAMVTGPDNNGNFATTRVPGNKGFYQQRYWLVIDPAGIVCGTEKEAIARFRYGDVLSARLATPFDNGVVFHGRESYLMIEDKRFFLGVSRGQLREDSPFQCEVRAHVTTIAPINMDDITNKGISW